MAEDSAQVITRLLIEDFKRRVLLESLPRIRRCLAELTPEQIWYRPNEMSNSIGNLLLHLNGNVRQWILNGLGRLPDTRHRDQEFAERKPLSTEILLAGLESTLAEVEMVVDQLTSADLVALRPVQCFEETGVSILMHVAEHFSYHTGQIAYITKSLAKVDLAFYAGQNLQQTSP